MDMINNFIGLTLQLSVPIILGALCGTIAERFCPWSWAV